MSASNWATCPRCEKRRLAKVEEMRVKAAVAYGKVPVETWQAMNAAVDRARALEPQFNLREDYEFYGAEEGTVTASYYGSCDVCNLTLSFKHEVAFEGVEA